LVEAGAGEGSELSDSQFAEAGARVLNRAEDIWGEADLIYKVKEPQPEEFELLKEGQIIFTFLHLASTKDLTLALLEKKVRALGFETVKLEDGRLPILTPMSQIAGKMAVEIGCCLLMKQNGGRGILLSGITGASPGTVVIIGAGNAGSSAAIVAAGLRAKLMVINQGMEKLRYLEETLPVPITTLASTPYNIEDSVRQADLLIGSVLVAGGRPPILVSEEMVKGMKKGAVVIDISVDQGGCVATSEVTTHDNPTFIKHGVIHYGVTNMPGVVPRTSTWVLSDVTLPYALSIAELGFEKAVITHRALARGVNTYEGKLIHRAVAEAHGLSYTPLETLLA
jgi:alanine dehydrogenase